MSRHSDSIVIIRDTWKYTVGELVVREGENPTWPGRWSRLRDCRWSGIIQTENTVRHPTYGRIRGIVVGEGGRSTGVLLYQETQRSSQIQC